VLVVRVHLEGLERQKLESLKGGAARPLPAADRPARPPWYVLPGDHKWFSRLAAAGVIVRALMEIDPQSRR
jgi:hypothetical protein